MKNTVKNMFCVLAFQLLIVNFAACGMDTSMQVETDDTPFVDKPSFTVDLAPSDPLGRREAIGRWLILTKAETNEYAILIGRVTLPPHPKTDLLCSNKRTFEQWRLDLYTPARHCSTYDYYDAIFSHNGSLFAFAEYNDDSHEILNPHPIHVRITVIDLPNKTKKQYFIDGGIGKFPFGTIKLAAISSDGRLCARLVNDSRVQQPSIVVNQLTRDDCPKTLVFDLHDSLNNSLDAHVSFTHNNKEISVQGAQVNTSFELEDGWGWTQYDIFRNIVLPPHLLPERTKGYTKPFIGFCDEEACKIIQNAGFSDFQQDDLVIYADALSKKTGISLLPVKPFVQNETTFLRLTDCTQVWFIHNIKLKTLLSSHNHFETTLFSYALDGNKYNPPMIATEPIKVLGEKLIAQRSLVRSNKNDDRVAFKYALTDNDGRLTISAIANYVINEKIITQTLALGQNR